MKGVAATVSGWVEWWCFALFLPGIVMHEAIHVMSATIVTGVEPEFGLEWGSVFQETGIMVPTDLPVWRLRAASLAFLAPSLIGFPALMLHMRLRGAAAPPTSLEALLDLYVLLVLLVVCTPSKLDVASFFSVKKMAAERAEREVSN